MSQSESGTKPCNTDAVVIITFPAPADDPVECPEGFEFQHILPEWEYTFQPETGVEVERLSGIVVPGADDANLRLRATFADIGSWSFKATHTYWGYCQEWHDGQWYPPTCCDYQLLDHQSLTATVNDPILYPDKPRVECASDTATCACDSCNCTVKNTPNGQ